MALQDTGTAGVDYLVSGELPLNEPTALWMELTKAVVHRVPLLGQYPHEHTVRVGIVATPEQLGSLREQLIGQFGDRIVSQNLSVPSAGVEVMEVFDPAVNKWEGVMHIARRHQIKPEQIIAIGDDVNDIPMIRNAGLGVAMGNAKKPEVMLAVTKRVIGTNREDGLACSFRTWWRAASWSRPGRVTHNNRSANGGCGGTVSGMFAKGFARLNNRVHRYSPAVLFTGLASTTGNSILHRSRSTAAGRCSLVLIGC